MQSGKRSARLAACLLPGRCRSAFCDDAHTGARRQVEFVKYDMNMIDQCDVELIIAVRGEADGQWLRQSLPRRIARRGALPPRAVVDSRGRDSGGSWARALEYFREPAA